VTLVVDAHHHLWDPARHDYPWLDEGLAAIRRRFGPDDLRPVLSANGVDRTVLVQTISSVDETREFLATSHETDFIAGVVGWVDLTDPSINDTLADLRSGPGGERLVGIRHQVHDEENPRWLLEPDVLRGINAVSDAGLVYDFLVRTRELPAAIEVAKRLPDARFVLDHMAKPRIASGPRDLPWESAMALLAECNNVSCKLSGLVTEAGWTTWKPEDLAQYVSRALDWFGPERCMFGSDWPVCLVAATYAQVTDALRQALVGLDESEADGIWGGNAMRVYRIPAP
jgi:L-fuconolactonase